MTTTRRSIFGMPGVVSLIAQLMMTFGEIRPRLDESVVATRCEDHRDLCHRVPRWGRAVPAWIECFVPMTATVGVAGEGDAS